MKRQLRIIQLEGRTRHSPAPALRKQQIELDFNIEKLRKQEDALLQEFIHKFSSGSFLKKGR